MKKVNKFRDAFERHKVEHPGWRYKSHPDSAFTWSHPALIELGRSFHNEWFGRGLRGVIPRRRQLIDIANELLNHLEAPDHLAVPEDGTVSKELLEYAKAKEANAADMKEYHKALALYCAIQIVMANEPLEDKHYLGGMVYGPLLILEGLLHAGRSIGMEHKSRVPPAAELLAAHGKFIKEGGDPAEWTQFAAKEYNSSARTIQRHMKTARAT